MAIPSSKKVKTSHSHSKSTDREKWEVIFNALKLMLRKQQSQLDTLLHHRDLLEQRLQILHSRWISELRHSQHHISLLKRQVSLGELAKLVEISKTGLLVGSKERDSHLLKRKLEHAESELKDFKAWFDILSPRCSNQEDIPTNKLYESLKAKGGENRSSKESSMNHCKQLEKEVVMLKREYEKLSVKNSSDVSSLEAEINFIWNQYKEIESKYTDQLQSKNDEINQANEKVTLLLSDMEQLESSNAEKDHLVANLKADISKLENEANHRDGEISKLMKELELLRSANAARLPVLNHCSSKPASSSSIGKRKGQSRVSKTLEEEVPFNELEATVATLRANITTLENEGNHKDGEISRLMKELELLRSASTAKLPVLIHCSSKPSSSSSTGKRKGHSRASKTSELEASSDELEATVATPRDKKTKLEAVANWKNGESSTLPKGLRSLRSKSAADTPVLKHCSGAPSSSRLTGREIGWNKGSVTSSAEVVVIEQELRRSKRKQAAVATIDDATPKLFTSQFKIPKLKIPSPHG